MLDRLQAGRPVTFRGRFYTLDDAQLQPPPVQRQQIPLLVAAHRPRMLAIAGRRHADQWDTFPSLPGTATDGVADDIAARVERFEAACRDAGRDPRFVRRSLSAGAEATRFRWVRSRTSCAGIGRSASRTSRSRGPKRATRACSGRSPGT